MFNVWNQMFGTSFGGDFPIILAIKTGVYKE